MSVSDDVRLRWLVFVVVSSSTFSDLSVKVRKAIAQRIYAIILLKLTATRVDSESNASYEQS